MTELDAQFTAALDPTAKSWSSTPGKTIFARCCSRPPRRSLLHLASKQPCQLAAMAADRRERDARYNGARRAAPVTRATTRATMDVRGGWPTTTGARPTWYPSTKSPTSTAMFTAMTVGTTSAALSGFGRPSTLGASAWRKARRRSKRPNFELRRGADLSPFHQKATRVVVPQNCDTVDASRRVGSEESRRGARGPSHRRRGRTHRRSRSRLRCTTMSFRSLKESRRFERVSSDEVRDHIDSRWYELVLGCGGEEQLARERVFAALPLAITLARYQSLN
jgi:hypothetical protein